MEELLTQGSLGAVMADIKRRARGEDSIFFAPSRNAGCYKNSMDRE